MKQALLFALLLVCTPAVNANDVPPRVVGFERFHGSAHASDVELGQLLLGELNCTSCHAVDDAHAAQIQRKPAPILDSVANRVRPAYLQQFLHDPQATKPGTTMPNVLAALPEPERKPIVEALVHFLATTGQVVHDNPLRQSVDRGEKLFHSVGCLACHDPRNAMQPALATSIPLGTPSRKYTLGGLTEFLRDPLAVRPGARMPNLNLTPAETRDIASYLLNDLDIVSGLQFAYYEGSWEKLPDFRQLTPAAIGDAGDFDLTVARRPDFFGLRFEGSINIDVPGDYLFLVGSDDGARLLIDDKLVVNNDGVHAYEQKRKKLKMAAGVHSVVVEYFNQEGERTLSVEFEGPEMSQQPLAKLLTTPVTTKGTAPPVESFAIDRAKAARGKELFASLGCASCHTLKIGGVAITPTNTASPLTSLTGRGGCLDSAPIKAPRYGLEERQKASLVSALTSTKQPARALSAREFVSQTMVRFNCYACHERDKIGGVEETRNSWFQSDMPEMGDEGRIPPHLTGVGAKLTSAWLKSLFDHGAKDRPYMFTRMPKFGLQNLGELALALENSDAPLVKLALAPSHPPADERKFKAAGRRLVGAQGFSCIKCHTFADKRSSGIQAISLTTMTNRLRWDWFYHYLQSPLAYRPGTRMPTAFPDGQTTLPMVLDGTVATQIGAIWSYLTDGDRATMPVGLVTGKIELVAIDEAVIHRNFIEGAGTRAIGVGYPEKLNLAFDASELRLALLWHGGFMDAAKHWSARGAGFEGPLGDKILRLPEGPALAVLDREDSPWPTKFSPAAEPRFLGYRLGERRQPTFNYSWNGLTIEDFFRPVGEQDLYAMQRTLTIRGDKPPVNAWFRAIKSNQIGVAGEGAYKIDGRCHMKISGRGRAEMRPQDGTGALIVPLVFEGNQAVIEITYDW